MITELEKKNTERLAANASECTVLLKKDGKFPLSTPCKVSLYGNGARQTVKGGTGSGDVSCRFYITAEQGLERAGFTITTKEWMDQYDSVKKSLHADFIESILKRAKEENISPFIAGFGTVEKEIDYEIALNGDGDTAIYVLSRTSGEGNDREAVKGDVLLIDTEVRDILAAATKYDKFILVLNVGGVVDLSPVADYVGNILLLSQLGSVTGDILADILLGKVNPSGKLTTTWASCSDYCDLGEFGDMDDTRYKEGIYVGYRWFDSAGKKPLYPFGFGLSYTQFRVVFSEISNEKEKITVQAEVQNIGGYEGKEVVQLYLSAPSGKKDKVYQSLVSFAKTKLLAPGETQTVSLTFFMSDQSTYDESISAYVLERGEYLLRLGTSSRDTHVCTSIRLSEDIVIKKVKNCLGKTDFDDAAYYNEMQCPYNIPAVSLSLEDFESKAADYTLRVPINKIAQTLSDQELAYLCVGAYDPRQIGTASSVLGNSAFHICGAAGETTNHLKDKIGKENYLVMADGPAGLRLISQYVVTENGPAPATKGVFGTIEEILPKSVCEYMDQMMERAKKYPVCEQYTTAIPIGTAIAQSWNTDFAQICGDIVATEMEQFHVNLWLAPALNIHRNILCGRNFEYYSEDPLISGKIAAALIRGVQHHAHCGATIKHFAANNQEYNRYNNNSIVSERALREIYLRGFEFCIRESSPAAVMTSYNLINGVHTSENRGLVTDILRCEWGFQGIVMTDWIATGQIINPHSKHPPAHTSDIVKAGNDITMAGCQTDYDDLIVALKKGKILREDLLICASRVLDLINSYFR